jgi:HAD superfamily hydrolase (TIGR01662 family)
MIRGILIDLGDTLIKQRLDNEKPLSSLDLEVFPDTEPTLAELKARNYPIAVVSNTSQSDAKEVAKALDSLGLLRYIDAIVTSVDVREEKPHPRIFRTALERLGLQANESAMIGNDIAQDMAGAQKLGMTTILVNREGANLETATKPTFAVTSLQEIPSILSAYVGAHLQEETTVRVEPPSFFDQEYEQLVQAAQEAQDHNLWDDASRFHIQSAKQCLARNECEEASSHFMRAAHCREQGEDWRQIGNLWLQASNALQQISQPTEDEQHYEDYDASQHFFMGIDPGRWQTLPVEERIGRAFRYAGYHLEKDTNQSAYNQYFRAGLAFEEVEDWEQAGRAFYLAALSFIRQFGELNQEHLQRLEAANQQCILQDETKFLHRARLYFRRIGAELRRQGNEEDQEMMFVMHKEINRTVARRNGQIGQWLVYTLWKFTSSYGTNFWQWLGVTVIIAVGLFPLLYYGLNLLVPRPYSWLDSVYFSVAAFVTLSYLDLMPVGWGRLLALAETAIGLFMLGSLLTLIINKIMR